MAFGFFNVEIDMLLLEQNFFFADRFCRAVVSMQSEGEAMIDGFVIPNRRDVGNVNGAIQNWDRSGFIGATYEEFPFPSDLTQFKQKPNVEDNRVWTKTTIQRFGESLQIPMRQNEESQSLTIGNIVFDRSTLSELVAYVDRGGHPRWKNELRPSYVTTMMRALAEHTTTRDVILRD